MSTYERLKAEMQAIGLSYTPTQAFKWLCNELDQRCPEKPIEPIEINDSASLGMDELYTNWFRCPKCNDRNCAKYSNFCQNCGIKLTWKLPEDLTSKVPSVEPSTEPKL